MTSSFLRFLPSLLLSVTSKKGNQMEELPELWDRFHRLEFLTNWQVLSLLMILTEREKAHCFLL